MNIDMYLKYNFFFGIFCRFNLLSAILSASEKEIIITHGTDTLIETGIWLQNQLNPVSNGVKGKNWKMCNLRKLLLHFKVFWNYLCMKELREKEGKYDFKKLWFMQLMTRYLLLHYFFL